MSLLMIAEPGKGKWQTKDGDVLRIRDMEDTHIQNSMRLIARNTIVALHKIGWDAANYAATTGGEMAADAADATSMEAFDTAGDQELLHEACLREYPKYRELNAECERRGLERLPAYE